MNKIILKPRWIVIDDYKWPDQIARKHQELLGR